MKLSSCLATISLAVSALAVPTSNVAFDLTALIARSAETSPEVKRYARPSYADSDNDSNSEDSDPDDKGRGWRNSESRVSLPKPNDDSKWKFHPSTYGDFRYPIIPFIPPGKSGKAKPPIDGSSTCEDAENNPWQPNGPNHRGNWGYGFNINTDVQRQWPTTFKTVRKTFTITNTTGSPVGLQKQMLLVNGQYPGPAIVADWGDFIEITVINALQFNGTGIHWHGFRQLLTNLADGAAGATECPIPPGGSRTYRFQATQYGSSWYHSHFSIQYGDGVVGPIIIKGPSSANYDIDLGTVLVSDYYDLTAPQEDFFARHRGPPQASNYLINGQNVAIDGSRGKRAQFKFTPGKKHLLRLINTSVDGQFKMSIDGHTLKVIQADFVPIVPYTTNEVAIQIGQRYHVIVEADQKPGNYYLRAMTSSDCSHNANTGAGIANAIVSYANAPSPGALPTSSATNHTDTCVDEPLASLVPVVKSSVDSSTFLATAKIEAVDINVQFGKRSNEIIPDVQALGRRQAGPPGGQGGPAPGGQGGPPTGGPPGNVVFTWTLGGISEVLDWRKPTVSHVVNGNMTYEKDWNVIALEQPDIWTFWIIQNQFFVPHPIHLHGHDFHLLGQGSGIFDATSDMSKLNFNNPPRRDVAMLIAAGWAVIAFKTDNPGSWLLHCHIAFHSGEGLSLNFVERPKDMQKLYRSQIGKGSEFRKSCKAFAKYENTTAPWPQYDSGLRKRAVFEDAVSEGSVVKGRDVVRKAI